MRIGWWAEVSITPNTFVFGTPNNHVPLIRVLERRGHTVELIHVPWKVEGIYALEQEEWKHLRPQFALDGAVARRHVMETLIKAYSGFDATMRTFDAARKFCSENEPNELPYDVIFMKLPPPGFLRTKLEVVYNMWRFCKAGVPVFCFDGDLMWDQAVEWFEAQPWDQRWMNARTPYVPKKELPSWRRLQYWYDVADEIPLTTPIGDFWTKSLDVGYVGNDWKQDESPRAEGVGKFLKHGVNAVWGRWTEANRMLTGLRPDVFRGVVNAAHVRLAYQKCWASVILGLPPYYKVGLVTQRYREVIQAGCLAFIDAAYKPEDTIGFVAPQYRVRDAEELGEKLAVAINPGRNHYNELLIEQRNYVRANVALQIDSWVYQLEALAGGEIKT